MLRMLREFENRIVFQEIRIFPLNNKGAIETIASLSDSIESELNSGDISQCIFYAKIFIRECTIDFDSKVSFYGEIKEKNGIIVMGKYGGHFLADNFSRINLGQLSTLEK
jgi:hypothetical protein